MEYINKVQLRGRVGYLRKRQINTSTVANFSVCIMDTYTKRTGEAVTIPQYINCAAWDDPRRPVTTLQQGCEVELTGRIINRKYTDRDGVERSITEVKADTLTVLSYPEAPQAAAADDLPDDYDF